MTGAEFYRMVQTVAHYEEKFANVVNAEDFNGGEAYTLFGFDISSIKSMCESVGRFLRDVEIGGKA